MQWEMSLFSLSVRTTTWKGCKPFHSFLFSLGRCPSTWNSYRGSVESTVLMIIQQKVVIARYSCTSPGQLPVTGAVLLDQHHWTVARFLSLNIDLNQLSSICVWDEDCISEWWAVVDSCDQFHIPARHSEKLSKLCLAFVYQLHFQSVCVVGSACM